MANVANISHAAGGAGRVPPQNLDAERSLLGAMLLSRDAIGEAAEIAKADDFYKPLHGRIYEAIVQLFVKGEPVDAVTLAEALRQQGTLDELGGASYLRSLAQEVPATANVEYYAEIVAEVATLRRLIHTANDIAARAYDPGAEPRDVLDYAEGSVFDLSHGHESSELAPMADLLDESLRQLEILEEKGGGITGTATGFSEFDKLTAGLQPSNLVIVAARPGMGKTVMISNIATHVATTEGKAVAFFTLEMSSLEVVNRMICAEGGVEANKLKTGRLNDQDWAKVANAIGILSKAPLFIDDSAQTTVLDVRAKCRRLKQNHDLGLVIIDYIQLMHGTRDAESRQVEVSEISRGLKILARDLETPVVAACQLNRSPEARADKRPMLGDLRESGCMPASTRLLRADTGAEVTLGELVLSQEQPLVWSLDESYRLVPRRLLRTFPSGIKQTFRLRLASGLEVEATANHPFRTVDGWRRLDELETGNFLAVPRRIPEPVEKARLWDDDEIVLLAHLLGDGSIGPTVRYATADADNRRVVEDTARRRFGIEADAKLNGRVWQVALPSPYRLTHRVHHPVRNWLEPFGLWLSRSHTKFIPGEIFGLSDDQIRLFVHHLWATDGSITVSRNNRGENVRAYYSTSSRRLAEDVQRLLLRLDIRARIKPARKDGYRVNWHVHIYNAENLGRFLRDVGCHGERSLVVKKALDIVNALKPNPNVDLVPHDIAEGVRAAAENAGVTHRELADRLGERYCGSYLLGTSDRPRRFSRDRLRRIGEIVGDPELVDLATSDVLWDEVVEITPLGEVPTFDATIEDTHNFVANGIVAHNSLEQDSDIVTFLYRDDYYDSESTALGEAEFIVAKHRNGPTGTIPLAFVEHQSRFRNLTHDTPEL